MGMAEAAVVCVVVVVEEGGWMSLIEGEGDMPLGEAIEDGTMKSSRFIESMLPALPAAWSADWRNRAIPLGGLDGFGSVGVDMLAVRASLREKYLVLSTISHLFNVQH